MSCNEEEFKKMFMEKNTEYKHYILAEGAEALDKAFKDYVKQERIGKEWISEEKQKQRVLEEHERLEKKSSAKTRNPMKHLTPKKKKRK